MSDILVFFRVGLTCAFLMYLSGCASVPRCHQDECESGQCMQCPQGGCCEDSDNCCNQDCQPKWWCTGSQYSQCYDDMVQMKNSKCCANRALKHIADQTDSAMSKDFKAGFRQAYQDIALGRSGTTPAVPPEKYWYAYYRGCKGRVRAQEWFSGYEKGSEMAKMSGLYDSQHILSSLNGCMEY